MKIISTLLLTALFLPSSGAGAAVGDTYLTAYDKAKGSQVSTGRYGRQIRLRTTAPPAAEKTAPRKTGTAGAAGNSSGKTGGRKGRGAAYRYKIALCGRDYYTTKRGTAWIRAHRTAGHALVVRRHAGKRKYSILCGTVPKRARAARKASTGRKTSPKN